MKAKYRFMKMYHKLPEKARDKIIIINYWDNPMSLRVFYYEARNNTKFSKIQLKEMGFVDDEEKLNLP